MFRLLIKTTVIIAIVLTLLRSCSAAVKDWSTEDQQRFWISQTAIALDWITTRQMAARDWPNGLYETNPILGRKPSTQQVDLYMIFLLASNYWITDRIPGRHRRVYLNIRTVGHGLAALNNQQLILEYRIGF